jgi:hypothetical protein
MVTVFIFPWMSLDFEYLNTLSPMRILFPSSNLKPACFSVKDLYFTTFLKEGGAHLTDVFFLLYPKNNLYALSMRSAIS